MTNRVRLAVLVVACAVGSAGTAFGANGLEPRLTKSLTGPSLSLGKTAALAIDVSTGETIYAHNSGVPFAPASNEKIPVSFAALTRLGAGYRFHTEVYGVGARAGSAWNGDLVLKGFGDPTLSSADLDRLAATIRGRGIRSVTGRVLGDESFYDSRRAAAGWKHVLPRGRDAAALGSGRRPRTGLARALPAAARGARVQGRARAPWRPGDRPSRAGCRPGRGDDARLRHVRPARGTREADEPRERQLLRRDAPQAACGRGRQAGYLRRRRRDRGRSDA